MPNGLLKNLKSVLQSTPPSLCYFLIKRKTIRTRHSFLIGVT